MWLSRRPLIIGIALSLPFFIANVLVAMQAEFFFSFLRPSGQLTNHEQLLVLALVTLVGIGGLVALFPILKDRRFYVVNAIVGVLLITFALYIDYELGKDFYHCEILNIPNCD